MASPKKVLIEANWRKNSLKSEKLATVVRAKSEVTLGSLTPQLRELITAAVDDWKLLRAKVIKTPEEKASWERSLSSDSFVAAVARVVDTPEATKAERMDATQVLIESLASNKHGPAKAAILALVADGKMDQADLPQPSRVAAAEDRAELLFHYLASFPDERSSVQSKMNGANAKLVFNNIMIEHRMNLAVSQRIVSSK